MEIDEATFQTVLSGLSDGGYAVLPGFLEHAAAYALTEELEELRSSGRFRRAGVGRGSTHQKTDEIRRDEICWFEPGDLLPAQRELWTRLDRLKGALNRALFLGLWDLEGHFAIYQPGGFYKRHVDRFRSDDARTVSVVLYLNKAWESSHGGELAIYPTGEHCAPIIVEPRLGTLVCFLSDRIEHEVREAKFERRSFAGWFRRR